MLYKRVLFIIDSLGIGGAEKSLLALLSQLNLQKYHADLWILHRGGELESFIPDGINVLPSPHYSAFEGLLLRLSRMYYSIKHRTQRIFGHKCHLAETLWKCTGWAAKVPSETYDVAIAYQQGMPTYLTTKKIRAKKKIVWDNINMMAAGYDMNYNRQFYSKADHIITVSEELQKLMTSYYPELSEKMACVYDILSPAFILNQSAIANAVTLHRQDKETLIVTVGRIAIQKNYPLVIETAHLLRERSVAFRWLIVGDGPERENIESLISDHHLQQTVILLGAKTNPYPYIRQCDIYVQTSSFEGFGLTIAEAKILGKPVVATNFDVVHNQICHEENGLIADMTPASVAENIMRLIADHDLRQHIVDNVLNEQNTTADTEIKKVESLLDED